MATTRREIIARVDTLKINVYDSQTKVQYIDSLEGLIAIQLLHKPHVPSTAELKEIIVPEPYAEMYVYYLFAMIDQLNMEYDSYNNNMALFNNEWERYRKHLSNQLLSTTKNLATYRDMIDYIDALRTNGFSDEVKLVYLNEIEGVITHKLLNATYTPVSDLSKALIIPEPYHDIYIHYLNMKMAQLEKDYETVNQESISYQLAYDEYAKHLKKVTDPKTTPYKVTMTF